MRLDPFQASFFKKSIINRLPDCDVYLFGSRSKNDQKGGDIDILVLADRELTDQEKRDIKIEYYKTFGERKIDIVSFQRGDTSPFKQLALMDAKRL